MGISGLIPLLKKASKNYHVRNFSGHTVGIDAYGWLHKGAYGCAVKLGKGEETMQYANYCMKYVNTLLEHNVKPVLVFDGRSLPAKEVTNKKRREAREENRQKAKELLREGKGGYFEYFIKSLEVTHAMARVLIKELQAKKIDYIIAPYEADAQLAYLAKNNIVDIIITEDSDLILFGCPKIFFKMSVDGHGVLFEQHKIPKCIPIVPSKFHFEKFRQMCILSGCDYLPSLPGIGLTRAKKVFLNASHPDFTQTLKQIPNILSMDVDVTQEYIDGFIKAENTFLYQLVFDVLSREIIPLTPYDSTVDQSELDYCGEIIAPSTATQMALGNIDPKTFEKVNNFNPDTKSSGYTDTSIWSMNFKIKSSTGKVNKFLSNGEHSSTFGKTASIGLNLPSANQHQLKPLKLVLKKLDDKPLDKEENRRHLKDCGLQLSDEISDQDLLEQYKSQSVSVTTKNSKNGKAVGEQTDTDDEKPINNKEIEEKSPILRRKSDRGGKRLSSEKKNPFALPSELVTKKVAKMGNGSIIKTIEYSPNKMSPIIKKSNGRRQSLRNGDQNISANEIFDDKIVVKSRYFKPDDDDDVKEKKPKLSNNDKFYSLFRSKDAKSPRKVSARSNFLEGAYEDDDNIGSFNKVVKIKNGKSFENGGEVMKSCSQFSNNSIDHISPLSSSQSQSQSQLSGISSSTTSNSTKMGSQPFSIDDLTEDDLINDEVDDDDDDEETENVEDDEDDCEIVGVRNGNGIRIKSNKKLINSPLKSSSSQTSTRSTRSTNSKSGSGKSSSSKRKIKNNSNSVRGVGLSKKIKNDPEQKTLFRFAFTNKSTA